MTRRPLPSAFSPKSGYPGLPRPAKVVDLPVRLSRTPGGIRQRPAVGEHTDEILAELGFDAAAIADLKRRAVV
jgi:crotonobetainyl-CoA:carnitine CoA-transferase CaiB-like acyl-CoA transferase